MLPRALLAGLAFGATALAGCASRPTEDSRRPGESVEVLPGVRLDASGGVVEFDASIAVDCHNPETPVVYLETIVCTPDTREHEALLVTRARPSDIHAALLLAGLEPGGPGAWRHENGRAVADPAHGDHVEVRLIMSDGTGAECDIDPRDWIVNVATGGSLARTGASWVFAGSRWVRRQEREVYEADLTGQAVGLHTFGSELVALDRPMHHDSAIESPEWIADATRVPPAGTRVRLRLRAAGGVD